MDSLCGPNTQNDTGHETQGLPSPPSPSAPPVGHCQSEVGQASDEMSHMEPLLSSELPTSLTPPGTPPLFSRAQMTSIEATQSTLLTPPHRTPLSSLALHLRTPSPPLDLPDLPGPPSFSDDGISIDITPQQPDGPDSKSNYSTMRTPRPPGAWTLTPQQGKLVSSPNLSPSESTPIVSFASTPLPAIDLPGVQSTTNTTMENKFHTPLSTQRTDPPPPLTPALPGAWMATPNQPTVQAGAVDQSQLGTIGRRRSFLKVRFDVSESDTSTTGDHPNSPISAIRLDNPELAVSTFETEGKARIVNVPPAEPRALSGDTIFHESDTLNHPTTPNSRGALPSPRSLRKSPMVRVVDAYGRQRSEEQVSEKQELHHQNSHVGADLMQRGSTQPIVPPTPRTAGPNMVRIVDAMGREIQEQLDQQPDTSLPIDPSSDLDDNRPGRAQVVARMREVLHELTEPMSDSDRYTFPPHYCRASFEYFHLVGPPITSELNLSVWKTLRGFPRPPDSHVVRLLSISSEKRKRSVISVGTLVRK